jgi:LPXTG-motif cell wall-anchored protein
VSPGGAAVVGAAAASSRAPEGSSTQWGWIAFAVLAAAVLGAGGVWLWRRRSERGGS